MANYTTRALVWRLKNPFSNLGLLLFEKNLIGVYLLFGIYTTMFVSLNFLLQAREYAMLLKNKKINAWQNY